MAKHGVRKWIAGALVGAAAMSGVAVGAGSAEAKIDQGRYKMQQFVYGVIPTPVANARVIGSTLFYDYWGVGPWNLYSQKIKPTRSGGMASFLTTHPASQWYSRIEFRKTRYGYKGTMYSTGSVAMGDMILRKVR
ncbi:hypothetical protein GII30_22835 [Gordonia amarae]|uniref:Uncharacterized protein n=2 Tax=Gordonia amarae TaxID=36821 RepID=G7GTF1_9ACTN|nr:hypothetical protein [Gordonia amarae]MCS3876623.1 hypothetical protein [Gordonia amarae]QHN19513.1 hypothetical protein GII35_23300 [Gordonia amarae]QHN23989.1 hypothetical protein GII34_22800 [Gordonia amarae]QHN32898.1 hypothetical protein GII32_23130 [Gordonia amarae]QHN41617.1 hypothetical protein GII30_22835 [Gordonia amarae]